MHARERIIGHPLAATVLRRIRTQASGGRRRLSIGVDRDGRGDVGDVLLPAVVERNGRRTATGLPARSIGEEAFADPGAWVGFIRLPPGATSGWHHHGRWDSYACVLSGRLRWEFGANGREAIEVGVGDTGRMPGGVVHRDVSAGTEPLSMILFRAGEGSLTTDVDGPDTAEGVA